MTTETSAIEEGTYELEMDADELCQEDQDYLQHLGVRFWPYDDIVCHYCWSTHVERVHVGLPSGKAASVQRCENCGAMWAEARESGEYPERSLLDVAGKLSAEAEFCRRGIAAASDTDYDASVDLEEQVMSFVRRLNELICENDLPITRAERDAILAVALPVEPEDVGAAPIS